MDLSAPITYNGWTATGASGAAAGAPLSGYVVEQLTPGPIDASGYLDQRALADGIDAFDVFLGARQFTLVAAVYGSTKGDGWDKLDAMLKAFNPTIAYTADTSQRGFLPLTFYRPTADISTWPETTYPYGIPLQASVRALTPLRYDVMRKGSTGVSAKGIAFQVAGTLVARNPRLQLQSQTTHTITTSTTTVAHRGSFPTWPVVQFSMTSAGSSAAAIALDGFTVKLDLSTTTTGDFTISYEDRVITDGNGAAANRLYDSSFDQMFQEVQPGGSLLRGFNLTGMSSPRLVYRESWQ